MKRYFALFLTFFLILSLTGCALPGEDATQPVFTTVPPDPTVPPTLQPDAYSEQLDLIWQEMDDWIQDPYADVWCYAVTDLDGNGRLEIISSDTQGTGHYVTTRMLEVSEDFTHLTAIENNNEYNNNVCLTSGYQSGGLETIPCRFDGESYSYFQKTTVRVSATEAAQTLTTVSFRDGALSRTVLGSKNTTYPSGGDTPSESCFDGDGTPISPEAYAEIPAAFPESAQIQWLECVNIPDLSREMLDTSWAGFSRP